MYLLIATNGAPLESPSSTAAFGIKLLVYKIILHSSYKLSQEPWNVTTRDTGSDTQHIRSRFVPYRPDPCELEYADVDYKSYGPINYKAASIYAAMKRNQNNNRLEEVEKDDLL
nr:unnamed protein product [Callosobruchus analis]